MSDLYRSALHGRIGKLPQLPHIQPPSSHNEEGEEEQEEWEDAEEGEEMDGLGALPSMGPPSGCVRYPPNPAFAPISASAYFASALQVQVPTRHLDFRVYYSPPSISGTVLVCHHGAGYSGLSYALFASEIRDLTHGEMGIFAFDARRHGKTQPTDGAADDDLSIQVLTQDLAELVMTVWPDPVGAPSILLVGHSMGGAVVVHACPVLVQSKYRVVGVVVLDVVEGTALEALPHMNTILNSRPDGFDSIEEGVEWHVKSNTIRNITSARVSVPSILVPSPPPTFAWRTPLRSTGEYWESWFTSLSIKFLSAPTARLLVLAGTDRLDKTLMIGQMQGKFQMTVLGGGVGHCLHEDDPRRLAETVVEFWKRHERVNIPKGKVVRRVGEV
ncbi:hypothetical protein JAAARDRAFT_128089 [Jaapia argillacea MUCL 33604]|uniref:Protein phosphatase methylesterase 1 n=1 Tax=Jaapia argillacea MUCL 33604 TaxID=933084 RepID=A0A067Q931_9AGAM|nr:hypothetical protein JAAARDRAFT_128089 [Jaapia argillacea MUCL 33604]